MNLNNLINLEAMQLLEEVEIAAMERRLFHARKDPFQLSNKDIRLYRVNKRIMENVIDIVSEYINGNERKRLSAIDVTTQVNKLIKLFFYI